MIRPCRLLAWCLAAAAYVGAGQVEDITTDNDDDPTTGELR